MDPLSRGVALHEQGRLREAAAVYVDLLRADPDHVDATHLLGWAMFGLGHAEDALRLLDRALELRRRDPAVLVRRADVRAHLGRLDDAADDLRRAIRLLPNGEAEARAAWTSLALIELQRGRSAAAEDAAGRGNAGTLGTVRLARGDRPGAVRAYADALVARPDRLGAIALADTVFPMADPPDLGPALEVAFGLDGVDHARFDRAVRVVLDPLRHDPEALVAHPLLAPWLAGAVPSQPDWEPVLIRTRRWLLEQVNAGAPVPEEALVAFALYGQATDYPWPEEPVALPTGDDPVHAAAAAMFAPIPVSWYREGWEWRPLAALVRVTHDEPEQERRLAEVLPDLTGDDPSSAGVRALYEESPYPRRVAVHLRPGVGLAATLLRALPEVDIVPTGVDVLVAGCGTGQHLIQSALAWPETRVLGIDLSLRSLARAARIAAGLGLDHVSVARADLLAFGEPQEEERVFDVVESVGVLQHLADPLAGWRALCAVTRPGGLMRIGLYTAAGRADIAAARALIGADGLEATPSGIREARRRILALPDDPVARAVALSPDFGSLSGCRDLLFHVREHAWTAERLRADLDALGLELLGFQHASPAAPESYRLRWPDDRAMVDLSRWGTLENEHPGLFAGMYVFWARRPAGDVTGRQES